MCAKKIHCKNRLQKLFVYSVGQQIKKIDALRGEGACQDKSNITITNTGACQEVDAYTCVT